MSSLRRFFPIIFSLLVVAILIAFSFGNKALELTPQSSYKDVYWFMLHRRSGQEELFYGNPGEKEESELVKTFVVKPGVPGQSPTPLPRLLGKDYWLLVDEWDETGNTETGPYFLKLNVDAPSVWPYGPSPYLECNGQCDWGKPGYFGLHGIGDDSTRLGEQNEGSLGCIRHSNEDITYLYNLLDPKNEEIRYYIEDN